MTNMWSTVEANCWCRGFGYADYTDLYLKTFPRGKPFSEEFYLQFGKLLDSVMENDLQELDAN